MDLAEGDQDGIFGHLAVVITLQEGSVSCKMALHRTQHNDGESHGACDRSG